MSEYLEISRSDMHEAAFVEAPSSELGPNQVRFSVDRFGLTANNITYGVFGEAMRYWNFFPATRPEAGRLPVWGFGTVTESRHEEVSLGQRVYGYWPLGNELVIEAGRLDGRSVVDVSDHRADLPSPYNRYIFNEFDPAYRSDREAFQILMWPLFYTSFVVEDFLDDHAYYGATTVLISSASSKTAIGAAFIAKRRGTCRVIGLTSSANAEFTRGLGCYDEVYLYEDIESLDIVPTAFVDVAGNRDVVRRVHHHFGNDLTYSMVVGDTHWDAEATLEIPNVGPRPEFLFAPVQMAKRTKDWGREGLEERVVAEWSAFGDFCEGWLKADLRVSPDAILAAYHEVLNGKVTPESGVVCTF